MYEDRREAGRELAAPLAESCPPHPVVLGLPRGGVPVGYEIARRLNAPLDVFMVRKVRAPYQPELAIAAVASGGIVARNDDALSYLDIDEQTLEEAISKEKQKLDAQERELREGEPVSVKTMDVIVVDDGLATGATMEAAVRALRRKSPASITVAVPVGAPSSCARIEHIADRLICPLRPAGFAAVGSWYRRFEQTSNEEVRELLARSLSHTASGIRCP